MTGKKKHKQEEPYVGAHMTYPQAPHAIFERGHEGDPAYFTGYVVGGVSVQKATYGSPQVIEDFGREYIPAAAGDDGWDVAEGPAALIGTRTQIEEWLARNGELSIINTNRGAETGQPGYDQPPNKIGLSISPFWELDPEQRYKVSTSRQKIAGAALVRGAWTVLPPITGLAPTPQAPPMVSPEGVRFVEEAQFYVEHVQNVMFSNDKGKVVRSAAGGAGERTIRRDLEDQLYAVTFSPTWRRPDDEKLGIQLPTLTTGGHAVKIGDITEGILRGVDAVAENFAKQRKKEKYSLRTVLMIPQIEKIVDTVEHPLPAISSLAKKIIRLGKAGAEAIKEKALGPSTKSKELSQEQRMQAHAADQIARAEKILKPKP